MDKRRLIDPNERFDLLEPLEEIAEDIAGEIKTNPERYRNGVFIYSQLFCVDYCAGQIRLGLSENVSEQIRVDAGVLVPEGFEGVAFNLDEYLRPYLSTNSQESP